MITFQILYQGDKNLEETIDSIGDYPIVIGNLSSNQVHFPDNCKVINVTGRRDEIRNRLTALSETEWQFYLNPGETLSSSGNLEISGKAKRVYVVYDKLLISKETRIWRKGQLFSNPLCEILLAEDEPINIFVAGCEGNDCLEGLLNWKKECPNLADVDYYLALQYLMRKEYELFLKHARYFVFKSNAMLSVILINYYMAQVYLHVYKKPQDALSYISPCLVERPLMAEFWCLVGDCFYKSGILDRAKAFFQLAIRFGRERKTDDEYPMEVNKYEEYPRKMIELCQEVTRVSTEITPGTAAHSFSQPNP